MSGHSNHPKQKRLASLTQDPVGPTLLKMVVPQMVGVFGLVVYHLVDTYYVGQLGTLELAGVSFTFPVVMVAGSLAQGIAQGASAWISRAIGAQNGERVKQLALHALVLAFVLSCVVSIVGILTIDPLFRLLGADDETLPFVRQYMTIWYAGVGFILMTIVGNNIIRSTGDTRTPAGIMVAAAVLNAVLDPILIFGPGPVPALGVAGASLATVAARSLTLLGALWIIISRLGLVQIRRGMWLGIKGSWKDILSIGVPVSGTRLIVPLGAGLITRVVSQFGPAAVAGYGVGNRMEVFALAFGNALAIVMGPFIGQNLGAGKKQRIGQGFWTARWFCLGVGLVSFGVLLAVPEPLAAFFNDDPGVVRAASLYMRLVSWSYAFQSFFMVTAAGLNVMGKPVAAAALGILQMFGLMVPLGLLGSHLFALPGLFTAIGLSYFLTGIAGHWLIARVVRAEF